MQVRSIKFEALSFASAAAFALSSALPVQSFPQWVTIEGEAEDLIYDFNSFKSLSNGIKQIDTYQPRINKSAVTYISCSKWRFNVAGYPQWGIIPPGTTIEVLAYKLCGGRLPNVRSRSRSLSYPPCTDNSLDCALKSF